MIIYRLQKDTITGTFEGKPFVLPRTSVVEAELKTIKEAVNSDDPKGKQAMQSKEFFKFVKDCRSNEVAGSNKYLSFKPATGEYFLILNKKRSKHAIPKELVKFIEDSYDKDIDFMPIVKAWARLLDNPRYNAEMGKYFSNYINTTYIDQSNVKKLMEKEGLTREAAEHASTYTDIAITQEGLLATYKVAEDVTWEYTMEKDKDSDFHRKVKKDNFTIIPPVLDPTTGKIKVPEQKVRKAKTKEELKYTPAIIKSGDEFYSGKNLGYVYEIGKMQYLPKKAKRNLQNTGGGGGLYIGGLIYIEGMRGAGRSVLTCFANPGDILSFQSDGHAIRMDALFPNNVWEEDLPLKSIYHSSDYGVLSEKRLEELIAKAVKDGVSIREEQLKLKSH